MACVGGDFPHSQAFCAFVINTNHSEMLRVVLYSLSLFDVLLSCGSKRRFYVRFLLYQAHHYHLCMSSQVKKTLSLTTNSVYPPKKFTILPQMSCIVTFFLFAENMRMLFRIEISLKIRFMNLIPPHRSLQ